MMSESETMSAEQARVLLESLRGADIADGRELDRVHVVAVSARSRRPLNVAWRVYTVSTRGMVGAVDVLDRLAATTCDGRGGDVVLYALGAGGELVERDLSRDRGAVTVRDLVWSSLAAIGVGLWAVFLGEMMARVSSFGGGL